MAWIVKDRWGNEIKFVAEQIRNHRVPETREVKDEERIEFSL